MEVKEFPGLAFSAIEIAVFAPREPVLVSFAQQHGLELSRVRDNDPVNPYACYFLRWRGEAPLTGGRCWISVCARPPYSATGEFYISATGDDQSEWPYTVDEGAERLREILLRRWSTTARPE